MRKLIIGCGYLGRRVAQAWLANGDEVAAVTRSESRAGEFQSDGIEPFVADVTKPETLERLPEAETVLFAVGFDRNAGPSKSEVYVDGLENTLRRLSDRVNRFLYISSTSVYGQEAGECVDEVSICQPTVDGGRICLQAEEVIRRHFPSISDSNAEGTPSASILRCAGIYGPGRLLRRISQLEAGEPIAGNPRAYLNLIHVDDAVAAVLACERHGHPGATYVVCDGESLTRRQYYETLARLAGKAAPVFEEPDDEQERLNKQCSNSRLLRELGVQLKFPSAESGLRQALSADPPDGPD